MESEVILLSSYVTGILHTARISTVKVMVNSDKWIKVVNLKPDNEMWKVNWSTWHEDGTKKKIWVPFRNWINDLLNTSQALYPLSHEKLWRARSFSWVHIWLASCILLGSALSALSSCRTEGGTQFFSSLVRWWSIDLSQFLVYLQI